MPDQAIRELQDTLDKFLEATAIYDDRFQDMSEEGTVVDVNDDGSLLTATIHSDSDYTLLKVTATENGNYPLNTVNKIFTINVLKGRYYIQIYEDGLENAFTEYRLKPGDVKSFDGSKPYRLLFYEPTTWLYSFQGEFPNVEILEDPNNKQEKNK